MQQDSGAAPLQRKLKRKQQETGFEINEESHPYR
jgi:hypothetical protein